MPGDSRGHEPALLLHPLGLPGRSRQCAHHRSAVPIAAAAVTPMESGLPAQAEIHGRDEFAITTIWIDQPFLGQLQLARYIKA